MKQYGYWLKGYLDVENATNKKTTFYMALAFQTMEELERYIIKHKVRDYSTEACYIEEKAAFQRKIG